MAKFLLRCAEDVDVCHAAAVIAGSVMKIALEMSLMIRAFEQTHASRYNNLCVVSDAVCTTSLAWLQSLNVIIDDFTFVLARGEVRSEGEGQARKAGQEKQKEDTLDKGGGGKAGS